MKNFDNKIDKVLETVYSIKLSAKLIRKKNLIVSSKRISNKQLTNYSK